MCDLFFCPSSLSFKWNLSSSKHIYYLRNPNPLCVFFLLSCDVKGIFAAAFSGHIQTQLCFEHQHMLPGMVGLQLVGWPILFHHHSGDLKFEIKKMKMNAAHTKRIFTEIVAPNMKYDDSWKTPLHIALFIHILAHFN